MRREHQLDAHAGNRFDNAPGLDSVEQLRPGGIRVFLQVPHLVVLLGDVGEIEGVD